MNTPSQFLDEGLSDRFLAEVDATVARNGRPWSLDDFMAMEMNLYRAHRRTDRFDSTEHFNISA